MATAPATEESTETKSESLEDKINSTIDTKLTEKSDGEKEEKKEPVKSEEKTDDDEKDEKVEGKAEQADGDDGESDEKKSDDEKEDEDEEEESESITPEFKQALAKQRLDFRTLEDLSPKEKRVVLEHATKLNRAFTKAQMELTTFRKEKASWEVERSYQSKNPDRYIADLLSKEPELLDKVNKELERRQNPIYAEALEKDRAAEKKLAEANAAEAESKSASNAEVMAERVASWEDKTEQAAKDAGLPAEFAHEAIANAILQRRAAGEKVEDIELTDAEISDIVSERASIWKKHVGAHRAAATRESKNAYTKEKAEDAKKSKPTKPRGASTERKSATVDKPRDMNDFLNRWTEANVG